MLKKILVVNDFNNPYTGGLGSFSLFLMLYAAFFIETSNSYYSFHSESTYSARLLVWFITFFGEYFDYKTSAIIFMPQAHPFSLPKS
mmetsp:Transcript_29253/g.33520  ORF Transcript_29253/g.33520 Transcript_29253/m.33520 type:complete len:87 (+) Transcript_29253:1323-1583(+)